MTFRMTTAVMVLASLFGLASGADVSRDDLSREDAAIRKAAMAALGDRDGAMVVLDPRTGRVLSIVNQEWAVRRAFHPASTAKLLTALAILHENKIDPKERIAAPDRGGEMTLSRAIATSSTDWFETAGRRMDGDTLNRYAKHVGFGEPTGIAIDGESAGRLPSKEDFARGLVYGAAEGLEATPIQLALYTAAIANGGKLLAPQYGSTSAAPVVRRTLDFTAAEIAAVRAGMLETVRKGTGRDARVSGLSIAGKTGTSRDGNGLFVSYAPADDPRIVTVVLLRGEGVKGFDAARVTGVFYRSIRGKF